MNGNYSSAGAPQSGAGVPPGPNTPQYPQQTTSAEATSGTPQQQQQHPSLQSQQPYGTYYMYNQQQNPQQLDYSYSRYQYPGSAQSYYPPSQSAQQQQQQYGGNRNYTGAPQGPTSTTSSISQPQHATPSHQPGQRPVPQHDTLNHASTSTVGQYQPPGIRPRVTTTMWEDEKTLCYQVDANNVSVVRRADNNMINGTKLLNVAQMTRGRRDGILKLEKVRHVVKIGSMHLKGVWIPFERALSMAQRENIVDLLYPLFVRDIKRVIQTGVTPSSSGGNAGGASANSSAVTNTSSNTSPAVSKASATGASSTTNPTLTGSGGYYQGYGGASGGYPQQYTYQQQTQQGQQTPQSQDQYQGQPYNYQQGGYYSNTGSSQGTGVGAGASSSSQSYPYQYPQPPPQQSQGSYNNYATTTSSTYPTQTSGGAATSGAGAANAGPSNVGTTGAQQQHTPQQPSANVGGVHVSPHQHTHQLPKVGK